MVNVKGHVGQVAFTNAAMELDHILHVKNNLHLAMSQLCFTADTLLRLVALQSGLKSSCSIII